MHNYTRTHTHTHTKVTTILRLQTLLRVISSHCTYFLSPTRRIPQFIRYFRVCLCNANLLFKERMRGRA